MAFIAPGSPGSRHRAHASPATELLPSANMIRSLTGVESNPKHLWGCSVLITPLREYSVASGDVPRAMAHYMDGYPCSTVRSRVA